MEARGRETLGAEREMKEDMTRILIASMLEKAFNDGKSSPRRAARNLVDLGVAFSKGRFQKRFLVYAQEMLQDQDSAYYQLLRSDGIDMEIIEDELDKYAKERGAISE